MKFPTKPVIVRVTVASTDVSSFPTLTKLVFKRSFKLVVRGDATDTLAPPFCRLVPDGVYGGDPSGVLGVVSIISDFYSMDFGKDVNL